MHTHDGHPTAAWSWLQETAQGHKSDLAAAATAGGDARERGLVADFSAQLGGKNERIASLEVRVMRQYVSGELCSELLLYPSTAILAGEPCRVRLCLRSRIRRR